MRWLVLGTAAVLTVNCAWAADATTAPAAEKSEKSNAIPAPARQSGEGLGPYKKLVIRGVTLIDGSGSPPRGPVDIIIAGNRIVEIKQAGTPGLAMKSGRPPKDADYELDASGMYVLPGFVDVHTHGASADKAPDLSYTYKLWLAHGVTTIRGVPLAPLEVSLSEKARSARNEIVAPHIFAYQRPGEGEGWKGGEPNTPEKARAWVDYAAKRGIDGVKIFNTPDQDPETFAALCDEARKMHIGTVSHLSATGEGRMDAQQAGDVGLNTVTHHYGHFESLLKNGQIQNYPARIQLQRGGGPVRRCGRPRGAELTTRAPRNGRPISSTRRPITSCSTRR